MTPIDGIEVPSWTAWLLLSGAVIGALRVITKTKLAGWLGRQVERAITDQVREVVREEIAPLRAELRPNGGASLRDVADRTERKLDQHVTWSAADRKYLHERLNGTIEMNDLRDPDHAD